MFGERLDLAVRYADDLATTGVTQGLIGPREVPRLWDRHLVNSAVVATLVPRGATVCDVGSGAGLPGVALAIARPDLSVTLVDPLARRVAYLDRVVAALGLTSVDVVRGRVDGRGPVAVDAAGTEHAIGPFDVVTARAVAGLDRLLGWLVPLTRPGGTVLALKGRTAEEELAAVGQAIPAVGATAGVVVLGGPDGDGSVRVVRVDVGAGHQDGRDSAGRGTTRRRGTGRRAGR